MEFCYVAIFLMTLKSFIVVLLKWITKHCFPGDASDRKPSCQCRSSKETAPVRSPGQEDPLEEGMATHSVFLSGESHGQGLAGYSPWGRKESEQTEATKHTGERCFTVTFGLISSSVQIL